MLNVSRLLAVLKLCDPAVIPELDCDHSNTAKLVDVVKLLVPPPALWNEPLCSCMHHKAETGVNA